MRMRMLKVEITILFIVLLLIHVCFNSISEYFHLDLLALFLIMKHFLRYLFIYIYIDNLVDNSIDIEFFFK